MLEAIKNGILTSARRLGYHVSKVPVYTGSGSRSEYEEICPVATYSPWNVSAEFRETFAQIADHTLVDTYRCWELWCLVEQSAKLSDGGIIEVGVWRGGTGALMAKKAALCGIKDHVFLCDTFRGVVKAGASDTTYKGGEHADTSRAVVESLIGGRLGLTNVEILEGVFPDETARQIDDAGIRFRLCHIDVDVYQSAKDIMDWVWGRMVVGGVVVYDDYGIFGCEGVTRAVNEQASRPDRLIFHNLNGHAIVVKIDSGQR